jgi:diacylglycerol kinase family enzyme
MHSPKTTRPAAFAQALKEICERAPFAPDRPLDWVVIANPKAGGFTIPARWKRHEAALAGAVFSAQVSGAPRRHNAGPSPLAPPCGLVCTASAGQAEQAVRDFIRAWDAEDADTGGFHLIITAGGDGTSREALSAVYHAPRKVRSRIAALRLPLGTGNDGADGRSLDDALVPLLSPGRVVLSRAVELSAAGGAKTFRGFNIVSLGLDAFVTHMTNRMKGAFPGDSYKLWVDIAALFYDRLYRVSEMTVTGFDELGNPVRTLREPLLLAAMGASGRRTYGSNKRILPDERNVCVLRQMSLLRKLALKGPLASGRHVDSPEAVLFSARRLVIQGAHPVLAQTDGETALLAPEDFPVTIECTAPLIPILRPSAAGGGTKTSC